MLGLVTAGAWAGIPLGGVRAELIGVRWTFLALGVVYVAATLTPLTGDQWKLTERGQG